MENEKFSKMEKKCVLKSLFELPQEDIFDILEILNGYKERVNKSKKDTLLARCVFAKGYHSTKEFYNAINKTKDSNIGSALNYETTNIKAYLKLKDFLSIDDYTFSDILDEVNKLKESD